jgi:hypothetical protein
MHTLLCEWQPIHACTGCVVSLGTSSWPPQLAITILTAAATALLVTLQRLKLFVCHCEDCVMQICGAMHAAATAIVFNLDSLSPESEGFVRTLGFLIR